MELINVSYAAFKTGVETNEWGDFQAAVIAYGASAVVSAAAIGGSVVIVGAAFGPAAAATLLTMCLYYSASEFVINLVDFLTKVNEDIESGYYDAAAPFWQQLSDAFTSPVISPLVLDMDGDGLDIIDIDDSAAHFDLDEDGLAEQTAWVAADDAFLAHDVNGNGQIDDLSELFGGQEQDGFTSLAVHDGNGDGVIDANDAVLADCYSGTIWTAMGSRTPES